MRTFILNTAKVLFPRSFSLLTLLLLLTCSFFLFTVSAQESFNATGGNATGSGGSASYSVGQVVYTTNTGTNGSVAQGVQQPYEISTIVGIEETAINLSLSAYPNPTADYLTLEVKDFELSTLHFQLYDMNGKFLQSTKITDNQTRISMSNLEPSIYFVKVYVVGRNDRTGVIQNEKEVKTFKIIKK